MELDKEKAKAREEVSATPDSGGAKGWTVGMRPQNKLDGTGRGILGESLAF